MRRRLRWRRIGVGEVETIVSKLANWPAPAGGATRHMFALSTLETHGPEPIRVASDAQRWGLVVVFPGRLVVPCGDAEAIAAAPAPARRWRLLVGDVDAGDALLSRSGTDGLIIHDQRFMTVDPDRVPDESELPDPGLRLAEPADLDALAELAVQLHVDDRFGPHPGVAGFRGYRLRLEGSLRQGLIWCVGPVGAPVCKVERSVSSHRWGVQLAGIVAAVEARHEALGRRAVAAAVRQALREGGQKRAISLHVRADNPRAIAAYEAAGFVDREAWRLAVRS